MTVRLSILVSQSSVDAALLRRRGRGWKLMRRACVPALAPITLADRDGLDDLAASIVRAAGQVGGLERSAVLIIPCSWCYLHPLENNDRRLTPSAAEYQLEEHLPLPLEKVTCAVVSQGKARHLGVALPTDPVQALLDRLRRCDVRIEHLYPDAFAAAAAAASYGAEGGRMVVMDHNRVAMTWAPGRGQPPPALRSRPCPSECDPLQQAGSSDRTRWTVFDLRRKRTADAVPPEAGAPMAMLPQAEAARRLHLAAVGHGHQLPDLCRGALLPAGRWEAANRLASRCAALAAALLLVWAADLYFQQWDYQTAGRALQRRQTTLFRRVLPDTSLSGNPAMRLASERIRLSGLTRTDDAEAVNDEADGDRLATMTVLRDFVDALPGDVRINLLDWNMDRSQLSMRGRTTQHRDAERIAECLNRIPRLAAKPPRTSRLESGGVEFTVRAVRDRHER